MNKEIVWKKSLAKLKLFTRRRSWRHPIQTVRGRMRCDPSTQIVARFVREFDSHFMWATARHANDTDKIRIIDIFARFPRRTHERSFRKKSFRFFFSYHAHRWKFVTYWSKKVTKILLKKIIHIAYKKKHE